MSKGRNRIGLAQRFDFPAKAWLDYAPSEGFAAEIAIRYGLLAEGPRFEIPLPKRGTVKSRKPAVFD